MPAGPSKSPAKTWQQYNAARGQFVAVLVAVAIRVAYYFPMTFDFERHVGLKLYVTASA